MVEQKTLRADAQRNVDRVVDAAITCLGRDPNATMQEIASEAGVGRVTAYAHFSSRATLVEAALARAIDRGAAVLSSINLDGDPKEALDRLIDASWELSAISSNVWVAAHEHLTPAQVRTLHDQPAERAHLLLLRGQHMGLFRTDLPAEWLVDTLHALMKLALDQVVNGKLENAKAASYVARSIVSLWGVHPVVGFAH